MIWSRQLTKRFTVGCGVVGILMIVGVERFRVGVQNWFDVVRVVWRVGKDL